MPITPIVTSPFVYDPTNVRSTFISLVGETYPYGHEDEVLKFLPTLEKDGFGNYYKLIGNADVMFTSHLDTVGRKCNIHLFSEIIDGEEFIKSDGSSILGADDKAGVTVMLYMMEKEMPGLYYFFIGEEQGRIGSEALAKSFGTISHLKGITKCVSFDRRGYDSVITQQRCTVCCSEGFAMTLRDALNKYGLSFALDPTGVYTDSASFMGLIPECTNLSVGYFGAHTKDEKQNIGFLEKLAKALVGVDWAGLPVCRILT